MSLFDDSEADIKANTAELIRQRMSRARQIRQQSLVNQVRESRPIFTTPSSSSSTTVSESQSPFQTDFDERTELLNHIVAAIEQSTSNTEIEASFTSLSFGRLTESEERQILASRDVRATFDRVIRQREKKIVKSYVDASSFFAIKKFFETYARLNPGVLEVVEQTKNVELVEDTSTKRRVTLRRTTIDHNLVEYQRKTKLSTEDFGEIRIRTAKEEVISHSNFPGNAKMMTRFGKRTSFTSPSGTGILRPNMRIDLTKVLSDSSDTRYEVEIEIVNVEYAKTFVVTTANDFLHTIALVRHILNDSVDLLDGVEYVDKSIATTFSSRIDALKKSIIPDEIEKAYVRWRFNRCFSDNKLDATSFVQNKPVNLKLSHYYTSMSDPLVAMKVDGTRAMIITLDSGVYISEGKNRIVKISDNPGTTEFILDAEVVREYTKSSLMSPFGKIPHSLTTIFVFDIIFSSLAEERAGTNPDEPNVVHILQTSDNKPSRIGIGEFRDYRLLSLYQRASLLGAIQRANDPVVSSGGYFVEYVSNVITPRNAFLEKSMIATPKPYYFLSDRSSIYDRTLYALSTIDSHTEMWVPSPSGQLKGRHYQQDGLIFQNSDTPYNNDSTFKWKPRSKVTIDFVIISGPSSSSSSSFGLGILSNGEIIPFDKCPTTNETSVSGVQLSELVGKVVEFAFDADNSPIPYRIREDKAGKPNRYDVALDNYNDVLHPILETTLLGKDTIIMRKVHNLEKEKMLQRYVEDSGSVLIDIGSGRGGDLLKWRDLSPGSSESPKLKGRVQRWRSIDRVIAIEPSEDNIVELRRRMAVLRINDDRIMIVHGGAEETDKVREVVGDLQVTHIASFFSLTFFFESSKTFDRLLETLNLAPEGTIFFGVLLDGTRTKMLIKTTKVDCDSFSIERQKGYVAKGERFGHKILTDIKDGTSMVKDVEEYLVDFEYLVQALAKIDYKLLETSFLDGHFTQQTVKDTLGYEDTFFVQDQKEYINMPHNSLIFSSLNRRFSFVKDTSLDGAEFVEETKLPTTIDYKCLSISKVARANFDYTKDVDPATLNFSNGRDMRGRLQTFRGQPISRGRTSTSRDIPSSRGRKVSSLSLKDDAPSESSSTPKVASRGRKVTSSSLKDDTPSSSSSRGRKVTSSSLKDDTPSSPSSRGRKVTSSSLNDDTPSSSHETKVTPTLTSSSLKDATPLSTSTSVGRSTLSGNQTRKAPVQRTRGQKAQPWLAQKKR
jgi:hypothetical protein